MSVKIDNDKVFQLVRQLSKELNNREQLALIDGLVYTLNFDHGNRTIRKQLEGYLRYRDLYKGCWCLREAIDKSFKDTKGAI
jgi:hypothetical protein